MGTLEPSSTVIEERLTELFPTEMLDARARAHDVLILDRKTLYHGPGVGAGVRVRHRNNRAIEELRRTYLKFANHYLCPSSFHDRLTTALAALLRDLLEEAMAEMPTPHTMTDSIDHIHSIVIADATIIRLYEVLGDTVPATHDDLAGGKVPSRPQHYGRHDRSRRHH